MGGGGAMLTTFGVSRHSDLLDINQSAPAFGDFADFNINDNNKNTNFMKQRSLIQAGFQELEKTKEYTERHYYGRADKNLGIPLNPFWVDFAKHIAHNAPDQPFLTQNFLFAHSSLTEMIAVSQPPISTLSKLSARSECL